MADRIFVTHASSDRDLADALVELLRLATGLSGDQIFCSSIEGLNVPAGGDFVEYTRNQLRDTALAISLVSQAYMNSAFCQWELGAIWIRETDTFPLCVPPITDKDLRTWSPILGRLQVGSVESPADLNQLRDRLQGVLGLQPKPWNQWERYRDRFLARMREVEDRPRAPSSRDQELLRWQQKVEQLRVLAKVADATKPIHMAFHHLRDAAFITFHLGADSSHEEEFRHHVKLAVDSIADSFSTLTGTRCRACIKQLHADETQRKVVGKGERRSVIVSDLVRSGNAGPRRQSSRKPDYVHNNTDFEQLLERGGTYFFANNLLDLYARGLYKNSHWYGGPPVDPSYLATIVWPIRKWLLNPATARRFHALSPDQHLLGFLCVDAMQTDVFDEARDINIGAALADTLFHVLLPWHGEREIAVRFSGASPDEDST